MFLLDTNVVSELYKSQAHRADRRVITWAERSEASRHYLSSITLFELEFGILRMEMKDPRQGAWLRKWTMDRVLPAFVDRVLPVDSQVAMRSAALHVPNPSSFRDSLIAATALVHGMTVVTRNVAHFQVSGVSVLNPWED